jgi:hypothetical protein
MIQLTREQRELLLSQDTLQKWAHLGLERRCLLVESLIGRKVSSWWLKKFYNQHNIKCLQAKWTFPSALKNMEEISKQRLLFCFKMSEIIFLNKPCVMVDETTVNLWMKSTRVWTSTTDRITLPLTSSRGKSLTIYGSVSLATNTVFTYSTGTSTNIEEFNLFLEHLRSTVKPEFKNRVIHLLLDNHVVHKSKHALVKMKELKFKPLMLPVASSQFNACE